MKPTRWPADKVPGASRATEPPRQFGGGVSIRLDIDPAELVELKAAIRGRVSTLELLVRRAPKHDKFDLSRQADAARSLIAKINDLEIEV